MNGKRDYNSKKSVAGIVIMIALVLVFLNPELLFFLPQSVKATISEASRSVFGTLGNNSVDMNLSMFIKIAMVIFIVSAAVFAVNLIITAAGSRTNRGRTVAGLVRSIVRYASWLTVIIWSLSILGVNTGALFASLGIVSLVIGFGAQSLVEDIITGIFIIFEGQYNVDDVIVLDDFRGTVVEIGVRTTRIMDVGGNMKIVNNSDIRNVQNRSAMLSCAVCDINISYKESIEKAEGVIEQVCEQLLEDYPEIFTGLPLYIGVQELGESSVKLRTIANVSEKDVYAAQRIMNRALKLAFDKNGIEIPFNQLVIHNS